MVETYKNGMSYQIIFTDFNMPVMNGIDATKAMKRYFVKKRIQPHPIIIGLTGHSQDEFKQQGLDAGMDEVVEKPLYAHVLRAIIAKYNI